MYSYVWRLHEYIRANRKADNMNAQIVYFSATDTTKKIVRAFADGLDCDVTFCDITKAKSREKTIQIEHDLVVIAVPIYGERIPRFLYDYLKQINGENKPLVTISVYGNMGYGISLAQFEEYARANHFKLIGAGTFIGEHTYASEKAPIALRRPDEMDLKQAQAFGSRVREKLDANNLEPITIPMPKIPMFITKVPDTGTRSLIKQPAIKNSLCNNCKACTLRCPVGAIDYETLEICEKKCIRCYACVKGCPKSARRAEFRLNLFEKIFGLIGSKRKENQIIL